MLKPIRIDDQTSCATIQDSAIDWQRMAEDEAGKDGALAKYEKSDKKLTMSELFISELQEKFTKDSLTDPSKAAGGLRVKDGQTLTKFIIGVIPSDVIARIADECNVGSKEIKWDEMRWRAFLHSVKNIEGWADKPEKIDAAWLSKTFIRGLRNVAMEIGLVAWRWNQLTGDEIKN